jgi:uncharacterized protein (TIGR02594 family)
MSNPYAGLAEADKVAVNQLVNDIFAAKTGVTRKLGPGDKALAAQWLGILRTVIKNQDKFRAWIKPMPLGLTFSTKAAVDLYDTLNVAPNWINIARREIGQAEIAGKTHNPRIMAYIMTCSNILQTANERKYVEREGEEGVEWCSAYVNWCLRQAGITGTDNALAASWINWGVKLDKPQAGAIAVFSWTGAKINHVAFVDEIDGEFKMLGGNQTGPGGFANSVTRPNLPKGNVKHYRWPANVPT